MLTIKQLEDAAKCEYAGCQHCSFNSIGQLLEDCVQILAKEALAYREILKKLEWSYVDEMQSCCPMCGSSKTYGHDADCELGKLLKESEVEEE